MKPKIAIACQGGGSQTAFTAGVLKALFANKVQEHFNIVSLKSLNYESKLDRCPESIKRLIEDGEKQGKRFLETRLNS